MRSLRELYRIGQGPSSSHTMAPRTAAQRFMQRFPQAATVRVTLYGSLAATGKGHLTDLALNQAIPDKPLEIIWKPEDELQHTNGMHFEALSASNSVLGEAFEYSMGGGALLSDQTFGEVYAERNLTEMLLRAEGEFNNFWEYTLAAEDKDFPSYLAEIWQAMQTAIRNGLVKTETLHGGLKLARKAHVFLSKSKQLEAKFRDDTLISAYAYAVSEENASGGQIVTAPTCGACGVVPAVLYFLQTTKGLPDSEILHALATAGLFGNVVKHNASISGAYVGCQGEVGAACAMAAAAVTQLLGGTPSQIEYAAEMALEHHLGLTCDPVLGLVQIPCIERNAHAALRAFDCAHFAMLSDGQHRISFDDAVSVLLETGEAMSKRFKETSLGGLALIYKQRIAEQLAEKD